MAAVHHLCTNGQGPVGLFLTHGRLVEKVARAVGNLPVDDGRIGREVMIHSHIHQQQFETVLSAKHVDTSAAFGEIDHLLPGDLTWRHAHLFTLYAVVGTKQQVAGMRQVWCERALHHADLQGKRLQLSQ